jgi:hypothetical protein
MRDPLMSELERKDDTRLYWMPQRSAFSAETTDGDREVDTEKDVGYHGVRFGMGNICSGNYTVCTGSSNVVEGQYSACIGASHRVAGHRSLSIGLGNINQHNNSMAMGVRNEMIASPPKEIRR